MVVESSMTANVGLNNGSFFKGTAKAPDGYRCVGIVGVKNNHNLASSIGEFQMHENGEWYVSVTQRQGSTAQSYTITVRVLCLRM